MEEMFDTEVPEGALFFISSHRRLEIVLDESLRQQTRELANELHEIRTKLVVPDAVYSAKCRKCSLKELCMPKVKRTARKYCEALRNEASRRNRRRRHCEEAIEYIVCVNSRELSVLPK